jgi:hypothetical protein
LPTSCADCLEIWEPQPSGTFRAYTGIVLPLEGCVLKQIKMKALYVFKNIEWRKGKYNMGTFKENRSLYEINISLLITVWFLLCKPSVI